MLEKIDETVCYDVPEVSFSYLVYDPAISSHALVSSMVNAVLHASSVGNFIAMLEGRLPAVV